MTSNDIKTIMRRQGKADALELAKRASGLDGTAIIAEEDKVPAWSKDAVYTSKQVGCPVQDRGQVYTILMPHTPAHNPGSRPADLRAIYGLLHTTDPARAKPWVAPLGISGLYRLNECCTYNGHVWRNLREGNEYPPQTVNVEHYWEDLGEVGTWK